MVRNFAAKEGVEALCEWPIPLSRKCRGRWPIGTAPRKKCRSTLCTSNFCNALSAGKFHQPPQAH
ncbi:MAG: hypothetical protein LUD69_04050 [Oscillospiraceae bacterium]|nr:hypothetical protein [Oscillospiraceae bacterium]